MILIQNLKILGNQQEADPRLIPDVFDGCKKGYKKLTIVDSDTYIVVITFMILMLMNFGLNSALVSTKGGYQYINIQSDQGKKSAGRYHFGMRSQVVVQYLRSVVGVKRQHGMFGLSLKKPQEVL